MFALCAPPSLLILTRHIAEVHEKKNHNDAEPKHEKPIKCSLCSYKFDHKEHLDRHIAAVHEKKKPFECSLCLRKFGLDDHLNKHIEAVHENNSYSYDLSRKVTSKAMKIFLPSQHK